MDGSPILLIWMHFNIGHDSVGSGLGLQSSMDGGKAGPGSEAWPNV